MRTFRCDWSPAHRSQSFSSTLPGLRSCHAPPSHTKSCRKFALGPFVVFRRAKQVTLPPRATLIVSPQLKRRKNYSVSISVVISTNQSDHVFVADAQLIVSKQNEPLSVRRYEHPFVVRLAGCVRVAHRDCGLAQGLAQHPRGRLWQVTCPFSESS